MSRENGRKQPANCERVEDRNRSSHKLSLFEEDVLGNKGNQVEDEHVLCYFSPYLEDERTGHFEGLIPMVIQVQRISLNAGQNAHCMETVGC